MADTSTVLFSSKDLDTFCTLSHDRNPLHTDPDYASRTPFGQPVVYGILGALAGLQDVTRAKPIRLKKVSIQFTRPLFSDTPYSITSETGKDPKHWSVALARGGSEKLLMRLEIEPVGAPFVLDGSAIGSAPRQTPEDVDIAAAKGLRRAGTYRLGSEIFHKALPVFGPDLLRIAPLQITALCWASYFVGMKVPGVQALFFSLEISFEDGAGLSALGLDFDASVEKVHPHLSMVDIGAVLSSGGKPFGKVKIRALSRPKPVTYEMGKFMETVGSTDKLKGKISLITGSSRGLGSLTAIGCAMHGSDVVLHYHRNQREAEKIRDFIAEHSNQKCLMVQGDVREKETWSRIAEKIEAEFGRLDIFINNAYPPIEPHELNELSQDTMNTHVYRNIQSAVMAHQALIGLIRNSNGCIVNISSIYVEDPPKEFAPYVMVKSALEGFTRVLAARYSKVRFITVRPPKLLTDQTNVPIAFKPGVAPYGVVKKILDAVENAAEKNLTIFNRFD